MCFCTRCSCFSETRNDYFSALSTESQATSTVSSSKTRYLFERIRTDLLSPSGSSTFTQSLYMLCTYMYAVGVSEYYVDSAQLCEFHIPFNVTSITHIVISTQLTIVTTTMTMARATRRPSSSSKVAARCCPHSSSSRSVSRAK